VRGVRPAASVDRHPHPHSLLDRNTDLWKSVSMKTTLQLPDALYRNLKIMAASKGRTLTDLIQDCISRGMAVLQKPASSKKTAYRPPVIKSKRPGTLNLTSDMIEDILLDAPPKMIRK
jgi:hypothetical protein